MLNKLKAWFAPPELKGDGEQILIANILNANMIIINLYLFLVILSYVFGVKMAAGAVVADAILFAAILLFRYWLFNGRVQAAGVGLLTAGFIINTFVIISMGSITSPATNVYVVIVIVAGVFFRLKGVLVSVIASSLAVLGIILAGNAGMLPNAPDLYIVPQWLTYSFVFLISGSLINYAMQTMRRTLIALKKEIEERKQAANLQETVYRIADAAQTTDSLQDLYPLIHSHIAQVMPANSFYIALYDESADLISFPFSLDEIDNSYVTPYAPTKGLTAYVIKTGRSLLYWPEMQNQLSADFQFYGVDCAIWLGVPLVVRGKTIGVMAVQHYTDKQAYTEREQRILEFVSAQVATAIDRKQTEEQLRESDERFRQIAENIQEIFWIEDIVQNKLIYLSPTYKILWGILDADTGKYFELILAEDRHIMQDAIKIQETGATTEIKYRIQRPDGSIRWVWDRSFPIFDETGKLVRKAGVATDITDVKTVEAELANLNHELERRVEERTAELRQSEETYRALFENSNDGIILLSPAGLELKANQRALDMLGYTRAEYQAMQSLRDENYGTLFEQEQSLDKIQAVVSGEIVPLFEKTFITKDGHQLAAEINLSAIRDAAGNVVMLQSVVRDITLRKKAEDALRQSRDDIGMANLALEKASRLKDEFMASMSHELRTPLTGILSLTEALQMQIHGSLTERQLRALNLIESSGQHLLEMINDILDLSKIEADKLELQFETCSIQDICNSSLQLTRGLSFKKHQHVEFSSNVAGASMRTDPRRMKQMLVNLLSNAIKFTSEAGSLGLEVTGSEDEQVIAFTVWDKGIGIKSDDIVRLFKPFIQLDASLSRQYAGTGLGLSLVDRLAIKLGGKVSVVSQPGQGSRFTLTMPWVSQPFENAHESVTEFLSAAIAEKSKDQPVRGTILFADDDAVILDTFSDFLSANAYAVITARSGIELVKLAPICAPDLILTDIQMPGMDGLTAIRQIRAMDAARMKQVPIIAITALVMPGDEEKCLQAGANLYISKPVGLRKLLELLESMIPSKPSI